MSKKICILNGSPRSNGNTKELIKSFTKGAEAAGHEVTCFDLQKMNIHGCLGCCNGGKDEECPCVQKDDYSDGHNKCIREKKDPAGCFVYGRERRVCRYRGRQRLREIDASFDSCGDIEAGIRAGVLLWPCGVERCVRRPDAVRSGSDPQDDRVCAAGESFDTGTDRL